MKSVGEIMAIGRTFEEAIQKGLRMVGQGMHGFVANQPFAKDVKKELEEPTDQRVFAIAQAFESGATVDEIHELTRIDKWFLEKLKNISDHANVLKEHDALNKLPEDALLDAKKMGFSDFQVARLVLNAKNMEEGLLKVRDFRKTKGILPVVKQIDTMAGEFPAKITYLYLTYSGSTMISITKQMVSQLWYSVQVPTVLAHRWSSTGVA
jgi:carbamoyl-phosphate synthase large subunit